MCLLHTLSGILAALFGLPTTEEHSNLLRKTVHSLWLPTIEHPSERNATVPSQELGTEEHLPG
jgi:hypothetical protein